MQCSMAMLEKEMFEEAKPLYVRTEEKEREFNRMCELFMDYQMKKDETGQPDEEG